MRDIRMWDKGDFVRPGDDAGGSSDEIGWKRRKELEYEIHRARFIRMVLGQGIGQAPPKLDGTADHEMENGMKPTVLDAVRYIKSHLRAFHTTHGDHISRLVSSTVFLPVDRLVNRSPYKDIYLPYAEFFNSNSTENPESHLRELFLQEFCSSKGLGRHLPLKVVTDVGGGGALAKIIKFRTVMKDKKTEWSQSDELPMAIPLPQEYRFHSVFTCPVSKEQATDDNPAAMLPCGHVIARESLINLAKGQMVKCPYCPATNPVAAAYTVYF